MNILCRKPILLSKYWVRKSPLVAIAAVLPTVLVGMFLSFWYPADSDIPWRVWIAEAEGMTSFIINITLTLLGLGLGLYLALITARPIIRHPSWRLHYRRKKFPSVRDEMDKHLLKGEMFYHYLPSILIDGKRYFMIFYYRKTIYQEHEYHELTPLGSLILSEKGEILTSETFYHEMIFLWSTVRRGSFMLAQEARENMRKTNITLPVWLQKLDEGLAEGSHLLEEKEFELLQHLRNVWAATIYTNIALYDAEESWWEKRWCATEFHATEIQKLIDIGNENTKSEQAYASEETLSIYKEFRAFYYRNIMSREMPTAFLDAIHMLCEVVYEALFDEIYEKGRAILTYEADYADNREEILESIDSLSNPKFSSLLEETVQNNPTRKLLGINPVAYDQYFRAWKHRTEQVTGKPITE